MKLRRHDGRLADGSWREGFQHRAPVEILSLGRTSTKQFSLIFYNFSHTFLHISTYADIQRIDGTDDFVGLEMIFLTMNHQS